MEQTVEELLLHPVQLSQAAQDALLQEVDQVFTEADNELLLKPTDKKEVLETLSASNQHAAPGTDGLTSFFYKQCFDTMGEPLTDVVSAVHSGKNQHYRRGLARWCLAQSLRKQHQLSLVTKDESPY